jgi:hypothetical protein
MVQSAISAFRSANNPSFNVEHLVEPVLSEGQYHIFRYRSASSSFASCFFGICPYPHSTTLYASTIPN